jgi:hypothetical protein
MDSDNDWQAIVDIIEAESAASNKLVEPDKEEIPEEIINLLHEQNNLSLQVFKQTEAEDRLLIDLLKID